MFEQGILEHISLFINCFERLYHIICSQIGSQWNETVYNYECSITGQTVLFIII
jgi:hypothetical protein